MIYNYDGNVIYNSITSHFSDNLELDYSFDSSSNANYTVLRIFRTKKDGTLQKPIIRYNGFTTAEATAAEGWELTINAGLGWNNAIDGIAIANGEIINADPASYHVGAIPLIIDADGNLNTVAANATAQQAIAAGAVWATCGFCPIIVDYEEVSFPTVEHVDHFNLNAQRQIIGQFGNGDYAIVTCAGRTYDHSDGWTLAEAQAVCKKLGLKFAYNLDGGSSTATYLKEHSVYDYEKGTSKVVPSFIVFGGVQSSVSSDSALLLKTDVINSLSSSVTNKPLSANMGKKLDEKVEAIVGGVVAKGDILSSNLPEASAENKGWQYYCTDLSKYVVSNGTQWTQYSVGLPENVIESISVNGTPQTIDANKNVDITITATVSDVQTKTSPSGSYVSVLDDDVAKIDLSGYALSSSIPSQAAAIADGDTGYATGDQVYDYVQANKGDVNLIESISVNGTAQTITNKNVDITMPVPAQAVASGDTGYVTGGMLYNTIGDIEDFLSNY